MSSWLAWNFSRNCFNFAPMTDSKRFQIAFCWRFSAGAVLLLSACAGAIAAPKAPPLAAAAEKFAPGCSVTFESPDAKQTDTRASRLIALEVPAGAPATPFLVPGKFRAKWEGKMDAELRDEVPFTAEGRGKFTLTINGEKVL
jgi:hypothetical protein